MTESDVSAIGYAPPPPPAGLGERGEGFWREITAGYRLRTDELYVLKSVCKEIDLIERMEAEQAVKELIAFGSMGQPVAAPLIAELRQHRALVARLLAQLKIPDLDAPAASSEAELRRKAANARWKRGSGGVGTTPGA